MQLSKTINIPLITLLLSVLAFSCQETRIPESCLENLIGESIESILIDSTINLIKCNSDSSEYKFLFGDKSTLPNVFHRKNIEGAPFLDAKVHDGKIDEIVFYYLSIGHIKTNDDIVNSILKKHFCIRESLKPDEAQKLSKCIYTKKGIKIIATHFWDVGLENIITIEYSKI